MALFKVCQCVDPSPTLPCSYGVFVTCPSKHECWHPFSSAVEFCLVTMHRGDCCSVYCMLHSWKKKIHMFQVFLKLTASGLWIFRRFLSLNQRFKGLWIFHGQSFYNFPCDKMIIILSPLSQILWRTAGSWCGQIMFSPLLHYGLSTSHWNIQKIRNMSVARAS